MFPRSCHAIGHALVVLDTHSADTEPLRSTRAPGRGDRGFFAGDTSAQIFVVKNWKGAALMDPRLKAFLTGALIAFLLMLERNQRHHAHCTQCYQPLHINTLYSRPRHPQDALSLSEDNSYLPSS